MLLPAAITMFAVACSPAGLARQLGGKVLVIAGCLIGSVAMAILAFAHGHTWEIYLSTAIMGIGFGLAFSAIAALVVAAVPSSQTGVASGMNANIRTIGGSVGSAVMASIVTSQLQPSGLPEESGYTLGFAVMAGGLVLAAVAGLLIPQASQLRRTAGGDGARRGRDGRRQDVGIGERERVTGLQPWPERGERRQQSGARRGTARRAAAPRVRAQRSPDPRRRARRAGESGGRREHGGDRRPGGVALALSTAGSPARTP